MIICFFCSALYYQLMLSIGANYQRNLRIFINTFTSGDTNAVPWASLSSFAGDTNVVPLASLSSFAGYREENFVNCADVKVLIYLRIFLKILIYLRGKCRSGVRSIDRT